MPSTLVTGANGFVAAHVINNLVAAGHQVTGSVRKASSGKEIFDAHPEWLGKLDIVVVEDIANEESWNEVFKNGNFDYVQHVAAPLLDDPRNTDYDTHFLKPSVEGNLAILRAAKAHAPGLKALVVTGSVNASTTGSPEELLKGPLTDETWLPISQEEARKMNNAYISYCSAKKESELAIWDFVKTQSPSFAVTVLLPALIFGPPIQPIHNGVKGLNYSSNAVYGLMNGSNETVPATTFPSYIDVRDLADALVRSQTEAKVANKRLNIGGVKMSYTDLVHALKRAPALKDRKLPEDSGEDKKVTYPEIKAQWANEALNMEFRTLDQTMSDMADRFVELEKITV